MKTLHVNIANKKAVYCRRGGDIVCGNSDYQIKFTFDADWSAYRTKTARFVHNGAYTDVPFTGDTVTVPMIHNADSLKVGVYAGDLCTTTPAEIKCIPSISSLTDSPSAENDENWANKAKEEADRAEAAANEAATIAATGAAAEAARAKAEQERATAEGERVAAEAARANELKELREQLKNPVQDESLTIKKMVVGTLGYVTPEMFGAVGDGETDDTTAIQNAIDSGYTVVFSPKTYFISGIHIGQDTVIEGNGATLLGTGVQVGTRGLVIISTEEDENKRVSLSMKDLKVTQYSHVALLLNLHYLNSLTIDNCIFDGKGWVNGIEQVGDNGSYVGASCNALLYNSENITIKNSVFTKSHGFGLFCVGNKGALICDNEFSWTNRGGLYIKESNENISVQRNKILHTVKNFTVSDGALDLYGPDNDHIEISDNHIYGFGSANTTSACGCRIKGSKNVRFCGNKIETDATTNCFAILMLQDRDAIGNDSVVVDSNFLTAKEAIKVSYGVRIDNTDAIAKNTYITNNIFDLGVVVSADISIRRTVDKLTIAGNIFNVLQFYNELPNLGKYSNIMIENNRCANIDARHTDTLTIVGNNFYNETANPPLLFSNSDRVVVSGNIVTSKNTTKWYVADNCTEVLIAEDNIFETRSEKGTSVSKDFAEEKQGNEVAIDTAEEEIIGLCVYGKTEYDSSIEPTLYDRDDYASTNADQKMKLLIFQDDNAVGQFSDTFVRHALHAKSEEYANYRDASGQLWYSNYRDWRRRVDVHLVEEKVFDGTENWTLYSSGSSSYLICPFDSGKLAMGAVSPRRENLELVISNFARDYYYFGYTTSAGTVRINNTSGTGISYSTTDFTVEEWKAYLAEQYNAGTPLKVLYALAIPYETPIPESEEYTDAELFLPSRTPNYVCSFEDATITALVAFKNDQRVKAIKQLIAWA